MPSSETPVAEQGLTAAAGITPPDWCLDARDEWLALRDMACQVNGLVYSTYETVNGVTTLTGEINMSVIHLLFGSPNDDTIAYQIMVIPINGFGVARAASVSGTASPDGILAGCELAEESFPSQTLEPIEGLESQDGESFFDTTATLPLPTSIEFCHTRWDLTFTNPGHPPATQSYTQEEFRCDNATEGPNRRVGCVVPWAGEYLVYSTANTPELASHVLRAQQSGLPGAPGGTPLTRTTDGLRIDSNRDRACGDAPSIAGMSCDEYPVATSREGLGSLELFDWEAARRTFTGCNFTLPAQTGPVGASSCMIAEGDNDSQGGTNSAFYRLWRVLDGDPFFVSVQ